MEEWSKNVTIEESATKHSYWQNIYHSQDTRHDLDPSPLLPLLGEAVSQKTGGKLALDTLRTSAANRSIGEVVQSRRRPLLGPTPG